MVAYGMGPVPGGARGVAGVEATVSLGNSMSPSGTFVLGDAEQQGADYQAAVQAASQGPEGSAPHLCCCFACCVTPFCTACEQAGKG